MTASHGASTIASIVGGGPVEFQFTTPAGKILWTPQPENGDAVGHIVDSVKANSQSPDWPDPVTFESGGTLHELTAVAARTYYFNNVMALGVKNDTALEVGTVINQFELWQGNRGSGTLIFTTGGTPLSNFAFSNIVDGADEFWLYSIGSGADLATSTVHTVYFVPV